MRNAGIIALLLFFLVLWSSCRSDFETVESTGNLQFSKDTVYLDTIFTNIGSTTYTLKVYNRSNRDITIPEIQLGMGEDSRYRLNADGLPGKRFENVDVLAGDSLYVFIETTIDKENFPVDEDQFLYTDVLRFKSRAHSQEIPLITLVKEAVFLYPNKDADGAIETIPFGTDESQEETFVKGFFLEDKDLDFTSGKPYVIYGYAAVPPGKTLEVNAGARIHFHANSGIIVKEGASIRVNGAYSENQELLQNEVIFEGDRLEQRFSDIPGQWGTIWLAPGSINNSFTYTTIRNATIGLLVEGNREDSSSPLLITNTQIYNSSSSGILAHNAVIEGENLIINNSGQAALHLALGGNYEFRHSTFTNYWQKGYRQFPSVYISNSWLGSEGNFVSDLTTAHFSNCIIYGSQDIELLFNRDESAVFNLRFQNSLIKFRDVNDRFSEIATYDFSDSELYENIILNGDPLFQGPQQNNLKLSENSSARDMGKLSTAVKTPLDLLQVSRTSSPDAGAYEWVPENPETENLSSHNN